MENIIYILIAVLGMTIGLIVLIRDIKNDKESDRIYELMWFRESSCTEKSEHCDYCGTDSCLYHPNND
jgi:hypothetical protein